MAVHDLAAVHHLISISGFPHALEKLRFMLKHDPEGCFVTEDTDGGIVGCAFSGVRGRVAWFGPLAVCRERQGRGIGSELFRRFDARARAVADVGVLCVREDNLPAITIYTRQGYRPVTRCYYVGGRLGLLPDPDELKLDSAFIISSVQREDLAWISLLDREVYGAVRCHDLRYIYDQNPAGAVCLKESGVIRAYIFTSDEGFVGPGQAPQSSELFLLLAELKNRIGDVEVWLRTSDEELVEYCLARGFKRRDFAPFFLLLERQYKVPVTRAHRPYIMMSWDKG
ncbi:MAG: GNAT family N-acetyltransferase [Bacillota bacterium]